MSNTPTPVDAIKNAIRLRHLQQLASYTLVADPLENMPIRATYADILRWSKDNAATIKQAVSNRVYGGPPGSSIKTENAFMAFLESAAMYLRDTSKILQAAEKYRSGSNAQDALDLLESSTKQIDDLAKVWGMKFIQICDLVTIHPDGHRFIVGPFCGAFYPEDMSGNSPFIGVAFKGTNVTREVINDFLAIVTVKASGNLWGSQVATGFYYPIFSAYSSVRLDTPFVLIKQAVQTLARPSNTSAVAHVTGHSLGGAYSSLTYAQLCIGGFGATDAVVGDLYTFGAPRVGRGDFAQPLKTATQPLSPICKGSSWRVVNNKDYVPKVPASPPWPISMDPFIHIDQGYKIYPDRQPTSLTSEIGTHPTFSVPTAIAPHFTTEYYKSFVYALVRKVSADEAKAWGNYPLTVLPNTGIPPPADNLTTSNSTNLTVTLSTRETTVVGTIKAGRYIGEITASGAVTGTLTRSPSFNCTSWKDLYSAENQCLFTKTSTNELTISFLVNGSVVGEAKVSGDGNQNVVGDVPLSRGTCTWTFDYDDGSVKNIPQLLNNATVNLFSSSTSNAASDYRSATQYAVQGQKSLRSVEKSDR